MESFILFCKKIFYIYFVTFWYPLLLLDLLKIGSIEEVACISISIFAHEAELFLPVATIERVFYTTKSSRISYAID